MFRIPLDEVVTFYSVCDTKIGKEMTKHRVNERYGENAFFVVFLMEEMQKPKEDRKFGLLIDMLPN